MWIWMVVVDDTLTQCLKYDIYDHLRIWEWEDECSDDRLELWETDQKIDQLRFFICIYKWTPWWWSDIWSMIIWEGEPGEMNPEMMDKKLKIVQLVLLYLNLEEPTWWLSENLREWEPGMTGAEMILFFKKICNKNFCCWKSERMRTWQDGWWADTGHTFYFHLEQPLASDQPINP